MKDAARRFFLIVFILAAAGLAVTAAQAQPPGQAAPQARDAGQAGVPSEVKGRLSEIEGVPVLQLWGTPSERGYAQGYLLGDKAALLLDGLITIGRAGGGVEGYEQRVLPGLARMKIEPQYEQELRGLLAGAEARAGGPVELPCLGRPVKYDDLLAANCIPDYALMGCSSFAAWGSMTQDGDTLTGRNMDWPPVEVLLKTRMIVVYAPCRETGSLGWASITYPGFIGCITGMNGAGVTVAMHDAPSLPPSLQSGFTPRALALRAAVESAHASTVFEDVKRVLRGRVCAVGNNVMVTRPNADDGQAAVVFEYDGHLLRDGGVTVRTAREGEDFIACTNHYRKRQPPTPCGRYLNLRSVLERIAGEGGQQHVKAERAWKMLRGASSAGAFTHYAVLFEPNKRLLHAAFAGNGKQGPDCKPVTFDVSELLNTMGAGVDTNP